MPKLKTNNNKYKKLYNYNHKFEECSLLSG